MARTTGDRKISADAKFNDPGQIKATLYNFDINGSELNSEHRVFLKSRVLLLLKDERGAIWMPGRASRSGAADLNQRLSEARASAVAAFLKTLGVHISQMQPEGVGEDLSAGHAFEDERDRCVDFMVLPYAKGFTAPPKQVPRKPPVSDRFKIRMPMQLAASLRKAEISYAISEVWDFTIRVASFYTYGTGGFSKSWGAKIAATFIGPWNTARTT